MKAVPIEWQPDKYSGCHHTQSGKDSPGEVGKIGGREVALVMWEEYTPRGATEPISGWRTVVYLKPWPNEPDEWATTKQAAQEKAQKAVDALTELLTTGTASPDYEWL